MYYLLLLLLFYILVGPADLVVLYDVEILYLPSLWAFPLIITVLSKEYVDGANQLEVKKGYSVQARSFTRKSDHNSDNRINESRIERI